MPDRIQDVYDLLRAEYGVDAEILVNSEGVDIDTTDKVILKLNPRRVALMVMNLAANAVFIRPIDAATTSIGVRLDPNGGTMSLNWRDDFNMSAMEWHGISGTANQVFISIEVLLRAMEVPA